MFKILLLFISSVLSLSNPNFMQYWDQNIKIDISTEAVVVPMNETMNLLSGNNYREDYCHEVFLDSNCAVSKGYAGRRVTENKSSGYRTGTVTQISSTLFDGIIDTLFFQIGYQYYVKKQIGGYTCRPASKYPGMEEGVIVPRFIQIRVDVGPMYHYFEAEFKSSRRISSKYTTRNIQNSFSNDYGKGNMVYIIRDFGVDETNPSSPKLIFQH